MTNDGTIRTNAAWTFPSRSETHARLSSLAASFIYPSNGSSPPSTRLSIQAGIICAANSCPTSAPSENAGRCKLGSLPSIPPSGDTSQRTSMPVRPRRARCACHLRHSTSLLNTSASTLRGGSIQSVGAFRGYFEVGGIAG